MTRLTIRIDVAPDAAFGPGKARLLELIDETGSIRAAAARMGMSYRRAWLLVREVDELIGARTIDARTGGVRGGGAALTAAGREIVQRYRSIEARATASAAAELRRLAQLAGARRKAPSKRRKP